MGTQALHEVNWQAEVQKLNRRTPELAQASEKEIKTAFRKLSKQHHPDAGGDEAKFKEVSAAFDVLGDGARPEAPHKAWPIPARVDRAVLARGRALFVGDAAGACDPMTGEGIGQALESGMLAADAILAAGPDAPQLAAARYRRDVIRGLGADHRMSMLLIRALRHRRGTRAAIRLAGMSDWTRHNFARWLFEDYPRAMAVTPGRWHRRMFTGAGAYG